MVRNVRKARRGNAPSNRPLDSTTSSSRASTPSGILNPIALAVLRLRSMSTVVACAAPSGVVTLRPFVRLLAGERWVTRGSSPEPQRERPGRADPAYDLGTPHAA